jgi:MFS transporter, DHA1 family, multidrug resistance protein
MKNPVLITLLLTIFIALLGVGIIAPIMPMYAINLGATGLTLGLMVAGFSISRMIVQPLVGNASDRVGRKRFLIIGLIITAVSAIAFRYANSVPLLVLFRMLQGTGSAMITPIAMAYVGDMAPEGKEGQYMSILNIAIFAGFGGGPLIGGVFSDLWGVNSAFYAMAIFSAAALAMVLLLLPSAVADKSAKVRVNVFAMLGRMIKNRKLAGTLLSRLATMTIMSPTFGYLPIIMAREMDASGTEIGLVLAARTLTNALLQPPFGRMADRLNKVVLIASGSIVVSVFVFLIPSAKSFPMFLLLFLFMGAAEAAIWPALGALAVEGGREYGQGAMMGAFNTALSIGIFIGSMGGGLLMDLLGIEYAFYGVATFLLVSTGFSSWLISSGQSQGTPDAVNP